MDKFKLMDIGSLLGGQQFSSFGYPIGMGMAQFQQDQGLAAIMQQSRIQAQYPQMTEAEKYNLAYAMQGMSYIPTTPKRKKVESKEIEIIEIRPEQNVKLLKAGNGI